MTQEEKDRISIFMMEQDGRISGLAGSRNYYREKVRKIREVLSDEALSQRGKLLEIVLLVGTNNLNPDRMSYAELLAALSLADDQP